jgi:hypothetical protein
MLLLESSASIVKPIFTNGRPEPCEVSEITLKPAFAVSHPAQIE